MRERYHEGFGRYREPVQKARPAKADTTNRFASRSGRRLVVDGLDLPQTFVADDATEGIGVQPGNERLAVDEGARKTCSASRVYRRL
jgi:hypothetical protein